MGGGVQESFLCNLLENGYLGSVYTCGGFIHQTASKDDYYPIFIKKIGARALYRMYKEPRTIMRVITNYPRNFILLVILLCYHAKEISNETRKY